MLPILVTSLVLAAPTPVAGPIARGRLIEAWRTVQGGTDLQSRFLTCALVPRCAWQDGLRPYLVDVQTGFGRRAPLPTIPPERPAKIGTAYVNVANAMVRQRPSEKARISSRLAIGTEVRIQRFRGAFAQVEGGFIHRDLLSAEAPTVEALLGSIDKRGKGNRDVRVMLLWRAFNLDPTRADVLERLIAEALLAERAPVVADALGLAASRGTWPLDGFTASSIDDMREHLYRAAFARRMDVIVAQVPSQSGFLSAYHELSGDGVLYQLTDALLGLPAQGERWSAESGEARIEIVQAGDSAQVSSLHLEPAECDWEILRGERTGDQPCKALGEPNEETMEEAPQAPPEPTAPPEPPEPLSPPLREGTTAAGPAIAFHDYDTNAGIFVKRWTGQSWQLLGEPRGRGLKAGLRALARQTTGHPALLYATGDGALYFERWNGLTWEEVAGSATGGGLKEIAAGPSARAYQAALAIDRENRPVVALRTFEGKRLYVLRLEAGTWRNLDCPAQGYHPSLVTGADGALILVFSGDVRGESENKARAIRYSRIGWGEMAGSMTEGLPGSTFSETPTAGIGPGGAPVAIWPICPSAGVGGARFVLGRWEPFGGGSGTCEGTGKYGMTVDSRNRPVVVFLGPGHGGPFQIRVQRWESNQWLQLGQLDGRADDASVVPDGDGLLLAWSSLDRIHVLRWDGREWLALPSPSGTGRFGPPSIVTR